MKKAHDIGTLCESEVYLVIYRHNRYHTYTSKQSPGWPPSKQQMVGGNAYSLDPVLIINHRTKAKQMPTTAPLKTTRRQRHR